MVKGKTRVRSLVGQGPGQRPEALPHGIAEGMQAKEGYHVC